MPTLPRTPMRSPRRLAALAGTVLFATTALAACKSDKNGPASILGTYTLRSVLGRNVPATVLDSTITDPSTGQSIRVILTVTNGTLTLAQGSTYTTNVNLTGTANGQAVTIPPSNDNGTYVQSGSTLTFTSAVDHTVITGTVNNNTITATVPEDLLGTGTTVPVTFVFSK
jgi:hypothetical protein